ncbi:MAG: TIGR04255 family protein [Ruminococcaceae bacterium]|nr:TIGR04255 family protein [Oscillospiraceae bacterium]
MFSTEPRVTYRRNQLGEVICQLRFPEILAISAKPPVDFQEAIRADFPQYSSRMEAPAPKLAGVPGNLSLQNQPAVINYQFVSADGIWRVNLTAKFISLACSRYTSWEDFAARLDKPLAAFIQTYKPAYFERIGLRYVNFFSRRALSLEGTPFRELIAEKYLGILADEQIPEASTARATVDAEIAIRGGCRVKLHAGPGQVRRSGQSDGEVKFIFDQDLYMPGKIAPNLSAPALQTLHAQAWSIFRDAITDDLHDAMEPID